MFTSLRSLPSSLTPTGLGPAVAVSWVLLAAPPAAGQDCDWSLLSGPTPQKRHSAPLVYDAGRDVIVLFGGLDGNTGNRGELYGDTWEWDGHWHRVAQTGPTPRIGHAMVYDTDRNVTLLFGGNDGVYRSDLWEWDGLSWRFISDTGPRSRGRHGLAYDSDRGVVVLFGGAPRSGEETWEWDGRDWTQHHVAGPSPRTRIAMAYDPSRGVTVLFGGRADDGGHNLGDTWTWDGREWTLLAETGPPPRSRHVMVYDSTREVIVQYGGSWGWRDTWEWDGIAWRQIGSLGPSARMYYGMAYHQQRREVILFGGWSGSEALDDMWAFRCGGGISLTVNATCPGGGPIRVEWEDATPDGPAALLFARETGAVTIPPNRHCAGTRLGLGPNQLQLAWQGRSDVNGARTLNATAPRAACGGHLQLLDISTCGTSNVATIE